MREIKFRGKTLSEKITELLADCLAISEVENEATKKQMFETALKNAYTLGVMYCKDVEEGA